MAVATKKGKTKRKANKTLKRPSARYATSNSLGDPPTFGLGFKFKSVNLPVVFATVSLVLALLHVDANYVDAHSTGFTWTLGYGIIYMPLQVISAFAAVITYFRTASLKKLTTRQHGVFISILALSLLAATAGAGAVSHYYQSRQAKQDAIESATANKYLTAADKEARDISYSRRQIHAYKFTYVPESFVATPPDAYLPEGQPTIYIYQWVYNPKVSGNHSLLTLSSYSNAQYMQYVHLPAVSGIDIGNTAWGEPVTLYSTVYHSIYEDLYVTRKDDTFLTVSTGDSTSSNEWINGARQITRQNIFLMLNSLQPAN